VDFEAKSGRVFISGERLAGWSCVQLSPERC
jgi:hypothetical protein